MFNIPCIKQSCRHLKSHSTDKVSGRHLFAPGIHQKIQALSGGVLSLPANNSDLPTMELEKIHEERVPAPLFRLIMLQQPRAATANASVPKRQTLQAHVDLHRDPKLKYITILTEDKSGAAEILRPGQSWINRPIASLKGKRRIVLGEGTARLHAVYSASIVLVGNSADAAELLESLTANTIAHGISSVSVSAQSR
jgi:hypothetical protein